MKKQYLGIFTMFLALALMFTSISGSAMAAGENEENGLAVTQIDIDSLSAQARSTLKQAVENDLQIAESYAYLDISEVSQAEREVILAARENIIFHNSWFNADLCEGAAVTDLEGNVLREVPAFQEIFPQDWDVPVEDATSIQVPAQSESQSQIPNSFSDSYGVAATGSTLIHSEYYPDTWVTNPPSSGNTPWYGSVVCAAQGSSADDRKTVGQAVTKATGTLNMGISLLLPQAEISMAYVENVTEGETFMTYGALGFSYGMRASTYGTPRNMDFYTIWLEDR